MPGAYNLNSTASCNGKCSEIGNLDVTFGMKLSLLNIISPPIYSTVKDKCNYIYNECSEDEKCYYKNVNTREGNVCSVKFEL